MGSSHILPRRKLTKPAGRDQPAPEKKPRNLLTALKDIHAQACGADRRFHNLRRTPALLPLLPFLKRTHSVPARERKGHFKIHLTADFCLHLLLSLQGESAIILTSISDKVGMQAHQGEVGCMRGTHRSVTENERWAIEPFDVQGGQNCGIRARVICGDGRRASSDTYSVRTTRRLLPPLPGETRRADKPLTTTEQSSSCRE